jgi:Rrf2 family protein
MRTISKKTQYILRALYSLAREYGGAPVLISTLAEEECIPKKFLEQILLGLKYHGLVDSKRGKGGGYTLLKRPDQITIGSLIRLSDGPLAPLPCASETAYRKCGECPDARACGTRIVMREVRDATANILDNTTLADVCRRMDNALEELQTGEALMYYI